MPLIQILGVEGYQPTDELKGNVQAALRDLDLQIRVEEITEIESLLSFKISRIPALIINNEVISQKRVPSVRELHKVFGRTFLPAVAPSGIQTILVPTDFSQTARQALAYARALAARWKIGLQVVHVQEGPVAVAPVAPTAQEIERAQARLAGFTRQDPAGRPLGDAPTVPIEQELLLTGRPAEQLIWLSKAIDAALIVMGTNGEPGLLKKYLGSISEQVARKAHCPVLLIPPQRDFRPLRRIVFATDCLPPECERLRELHQWAVGFGADIHVVHVDRQAGSHTYSIQDLNMDELASPQNCPLNYKYIKLNSPEISGGLHRYVSETNADLLVVTTEDRSFFQELLHQSTTKELAFNTSVPLLVFHRSRQKIGKRSRNLYDRPEGVPTA